MHRFATSLIVFALVTAISGCKNGYNKLYDPPEDDNDTNNNTASCKQTPVVDAFASTDSEKNDHTQKTLTLLAELGCDKIAGVLSGQNLGYGSAIDDAVDADKKINNSYEGLIEPLKDQAHTPAIIGVDYAFDKSYELQDLTEQTNAQLRAHWQDKGFVTISWSPISPWTNDGVNYTSDAILGELQNETSDAYKKWIEQLDTVVSALKNLKEGANVTVLWRPFPQMNSEVFWWGSKASTSDKTLFTNLWKQVFDRFKEEKLDNILWVYSPTLNLDIASTNSNKAVDWAYPGKEQVDIVAPVLHNFALEINPTEYKKLTDLKHVMGLGDTGPEIFGEDSTVKSGSEETGGFDNRLYMSIILRHYPEIAYWVSWHDLSRTNAGTNQEEYSFQSLTNNPEAKSMFEKELFDKKETAITVERIKNKNLRSGF